LILKRFDNSMLNKSHKHVSCETCGARKDSLFCGMTGDDLDKVDSSKACSYYKKDQPLFLEGSLPRGVYCINEGKVKVYSRGEDGKEQIIHVATTGEIVGFRAMFSGEAYNVAANTLEESNICFIGKGDFLDLVDTNANLRNGILRELSKELADRAAFIKNMAQKSVRERLASSLLILDDIYADEFINLSREDLANFVGTATETLIRLLKDFKDEGFVKTHVRKIEVLDKEGLLQLAGS
jgi:CRP-like cAMP-binding protein